MKKVAMPRTPLHRRVGVWLSLGIAAGLGVVFTSSNEPEGEPTALARAACLMIFVLFLALIANAFWQLALRKKRLAKLKNPCSNEK